MKIIFNPVFSGQTHLDLGEGNVKLSCQVVETAGFLQQLALHSGQHVEIPSYVKRLAAYHCGLMAYDRTYPDNMFHRSIAIDSMGVAKTLMGWRDALAVAGWNCGHTGFSSRLDALAVIEANQDEDEGSLAVLLHRVTECLQLMQEGAATVPGAYKELEVEVVCPKEMLPDYLIPVFDALENIAKEVTYGTVDTTKKPKKVSIVEFTQQYMSEAWLAKQKTDKYEVWLNTDNKRLDNWLHMTGQAVAGSKMTRSNPQITQMFLLAIQLFQRPLNVNTLLQYLYLPECPMPGKLSNRLALMIVREGGFASDKVLECITEYLEREFIGEDDKETLPEYTPEQRQEQYGTYLPFDLLNDNDSRRLAEQSDEIDVKAFSAFLENIRSYAANRAVKLMAVRPDDLRIVQLQDVVAMIEALQDIMEAASGDLCFSTLQQWAQSLYETSDYCQYSAQVGCRNVITSPASMASVAKTAVWCDFYGDINTALSTDFLSPLEVERMRMVGIRLWDKEAESAFLNFAIEMPLHMTTEELTLVVCKRQGATDLPTHPLRLQLTGEVEIVCGDTLFEQLPSLPVVKINNRSDEDARKVCINVTEHPVVWREQESFSSLSQLLQNPLDYFMNYILGFSDKGPTEIKLSLTMGNVAHETIEALFIHHTGPNLDADVMRAYDQAFTAALAKKGALLLLPEHHLDRDKLKHQLLKCVRQLAEVIMTNGLTVVECEQEEVQDLGFENGVLLKGYIDMLLHDKAGRNVVFDLKWTSVKNKYQNAVLENRATQLAVYQAMLQQHTDHPEAARTAFFVMPAGHLVTSDDFEGSHIERLDPNNNNDIMDMLREGYKERRDEISRGYIETAEQMLLTEIPYAGKAGVFPLEQEGKNNPKKAKNVYSDYKCFTL